MSQAVARWLVSHHRAHGAAASVGLWMFTVAGSDVKQTVRHAANLSTDYNYVHSVYAEYLTLESYDRLQIVSAHLDDAGMLGAELLWFTVPRGTVQLVSLDSLLDAAELAYGFGGQALLLGRESELLS